MEIPLIIVVFYLGWLLVEYIRTCKRLRENQEAWNRFSRGMTESEKTDAYLPFCQAQKEIHGWQYYYFPKM